MNTLIFKYQLIKLNKYEIEHLYDILNDIIKYKQCKIQLNIIIKLNMLYNNLIYL